MQLYARDERIEGVNIPDDREEYLSVHICKPMNTSECELRVYASNVTRSWGSPELCLFTTECDNELGLDDVFLVKDGEFDD